EDQARLTFAMGFDDWETLYQEISHKMQAVSVIFTQLIGEEDEEQRLEALRQFKQAQLLRIAAEDITGVLPVMKVSDHLTY
ncbi:hypothetical protein, partial [Proteus terrae]|uniref:hypothetical protein n=1 Tax=Proteus terrae TaxID=1574161 RepID=UPI0033146429